MMMTGSRIGPPPGGQPPRKARGGYERTRQIMNRMGQQMRQVGRHIDARRRPSRQPHPGEHADQAKPGRGEGASRRRRDRPPAARGRRANGR